jgi:hypothetical protein
MKTPIDHDETFDRGGFAMLLLIIVFLTVLVLALEPDEQQPTTECVQGEQVHAPRMHRVEG